MNLNDYVDKNGDRVTYRKAGSRVIVQSVVVDGEEIEIKEALRRWKRARSTFNRRIAENWTVKMALNRSAMAGVKPGETRIAGRGHDVVGRRVAAVRKAKGEYGRPAYINVDDPLVHRQRVDLYHLAKEMAEGVREVWE